MSFLSFLNGTAPEMVRVATNSSRNKTRTCPADIYDVIKVDYPDIDPSLTSPDGTSLLEELGRGAFGVVYKCKDLLYKFVKFDPKIPGSRQTTLHEGQMLEVLDDIEELRPFIPKFRRLDTYSDCLIMVQEYQPVISLRELLIDPGKGDLEQTFASNLIDNLVTAVTTLHKNEILHRDLKLENILVKLDGSGKTRPEVLLIDFGFSCKIDYDPRHPVGTCPGAGFAGTKNWLPKNLFYKGLKPGTNNILESRFRELEQHFHGTKKVDNFALGMIIEVIYHKTTWIDKAKEASILKQFKELKHQVMGNVNATLRKLKLNVPKEYSDFNRVNVVGKGCSGWGCWGSGGTRRSPRKMKRSRRRQTHRRR
jgi:serine/threonine protein kinase